MKKLVSTAFIAGLLSASFLNGCSSTTSSNDFEKVELNADSVTLFMPRNGTRIKANSVGSNVDSIQIGVKDNLKDENVGVYAVVDLETSFSLKKPFLESARTCSLNAGLPFSQESDLISCFEALDNKEIGKQNLIATYLNRGMIYTKLGDLDAALADYETVESISDTLGDVYFARGVLESYREDYTKMAELILKALDNDVKDRRKAYHFLGGAYEMNIQFDLARAAYQKSLEINPDIVHVQKALDRLNRLWPG